MFYLLIALLAGYALNLPLTVQADIHRHQQMYTRIQVRFAFLHKSWQIHGLSPAADQLSLHQGKRLLSLFKRANHARRYLLSHTQLVKLDAILLLRTDDAAHTALLTGALQPLSQLPRRNVRIHVFPDFFRPHSTLQLRCIIRWKLGTLLLTSILLLAAYIRQRNSESEA